MKNVAKISCLFLFVVMAVVLASSCASRRVVEQTNVVDRVGERVASADTVVSKARQDRHDSVAVAVVKSDSVVEQIADSVREVFTVDTAGNVIGHEVYHSTTRNRDHYHFADTKTASVSNTHKEDSVRTASNIATSRDSSLIIGTAKITEIHENEANPIKRKFTQVGNAILKVVGMVALLLLFVLVVAAWFYKSFKEK